MISNSTQAKILEVFKSIQGEGPYAGVPQVFVRLFECNMHCVWCDTPNSIGDGKREFKEYSADALFKEVKGLSHGCHSISITGGEPLVQKDFLKEFLPRLKKAGLHTYLDTNATLPDALKELISAIDIIAMDVKLPSSTRQRSYWKEHEMFLNIAVRKEVFIKAVISKSTDLEDIRKMVALVKKSAPQTLVILQPNYLEMKTGAVEKCVGFQNYCLKFLPDVRILPQVHKFMKLR